MTNGGRDAALDARLQQAFATLRSPSSPGHPSEDDWARYAAGEMSTGERTEVADHVVSCAECATIFRVVSAVSADASDIDEAVDRPSAVEGWRGLAAAAAVVLTIGLGTWWALRGGASEGDQRAGSEPPPIAAPVDPPAAQPPSWASLSSAPEVRLPPDLVLTMRGAGSERDGFLNAFGEAIAPYREGRYAEAAAALTPVAERYADVVEVWFYLGTARLFSGAAPEAIEPLRRAQGSALVGEDARWLQAVAFQRAGRESEARTALEALCSAPGQYRERACAVVVTPPK